MTTNLDLRASAPRRALLLAPLLLALAACGGDEAPDTAAAPETPTTVLAATDVAVVTRGSVDSGVSLTGTLEPFRVVEVKAQVGGTVGAVRYAEGDAVGQGSVMATIEAAGLRSEAASTRAGVSSARAGVGSARAGVSGARAAVEAAEAQLALAREQASSAQLLFSQGAMSRLEYQAAQAQVQAAEAQVASARSQLVAAQGQIEAAESQVAAAQSRATSAGEQAGRTLVRAPFSGAVSDRQVEPGEAVSVGNTLFTVVSTSALEMAAQVGVDDVRRIRVGAPVEFSIDAYPGRTFRGTVARIDPTANAASRQVGVYLRLPNPGDLVGGLFATGTVLTETTSDALLVPSSAVRQEPGAEGASYVLVVGGGVLRRRAVSVVARDVSRGLVAIEGDGIAAGTQVVVSPSTDTADGVRVRVAAPSSPAPAARSPRSDSASGRTGAVRNDG